MPFCSSSIARFSVSALPLLGGGGGSRTRDWHWLLGDDSSIRSIRRYRSVISHESWVIAHCRYCTRLYYKYQPYSVLRVAQRWSYSHQRSLSNHLFFFQCKYTDWDWQCFFITVRFTLVSGVDTPKNRNLNKSKQIKWTQIIWCFLIVVLLFLFWITE